MSAFALLVAVAAALLALWWREKKRRVTHPVPAGYRAEIALPHQREFELYHNALSLCSMKTRVCLAELGVEYASHHVDLIETGAYENIRARFLTVNPGGTVPVLVHRGHPIYESHEQIRYAARHAPAGVPALIPEDGAECAEMERWIDRSSLTENPLEHGDESAANAVPALTVPLFAAMIDAISTWKILEGLLFHFDKRRPLLFLTLKAFGLQRLDRLTPAIKVLARGRRQLGAHLDALEARLAAAGPWILGSLFSLADVSWMAIFERLEQADLLHVLVDPARRPACAAYWQRLRERPSYRRAIAEQAHPAVVRGTRRLREAKAAQPALRSAVEGESPASSASTRC